MRICQGQEENTSNDGWGDYKQCSKTAICQLGHLVLCAAHEAVANAGMLEPDGRPASIPVRRDVADRPDLFPNGVFRWADGLTAIKLDEHGLPIVPSESETDTLAHDVAPAVE